jgi:hypothetical protein
MNKELISIAGASVVVMGAVLACKAPPPSTDAGPAGSTSASASVSAAASASAAPAKAGSVVDQAWVADLLKDLSKASGCPKKTGDLRQWCNVDDFATGERDGTLDDQGVLFGAVVELATGAPAATAVKNQKLAVLAVDKRNGERFAALSTFADDHGEYGDARDNVMEILEEAQFAYRADIPKKVWADANGRSAKATSKIVALPNGWHWESPTTDVRKVGKTFVVVELTSPKSIRVAVLTDKVAEKK